MYLYLQYTSTIRYEYNITLYVYTITTPCSKHELFQNLSNPILSLFQKISLSPGLASSPGHLRYVQVLKINLKLLSAISVTWMGTKMEILKGMFQGSHQLLKNLLSLGEQQKKDILILRPKNFYQTRAYSCRLNSSLGHNSSLGSQNEKPRAE